VRSSCKREGELLSLSLDGERGRGRSSSTRLISFQLPELVVVYSSRSLPFQTFFHISSI
jgi:hypothetical protein